MPIRLVTDGWPRLAALTLFAEGAPLHGLAGSSQRRISKVLDQLPQSRRGAAGFPEGDPKQAGGMRKIRRRTTSESKPLADANVNPLIANAADDIVGPRAKIPKGRFGDYLDQVERLASNRKIGAKQRRLLEKHRSTTEHGYQGKETTSTRRAEFSKKKDRLIKEWERETGQSWPTYRNDVPSADPNASPFRAAGGYYDAHEIIPNSYGGPQEWWNIHPAKAPVQHQGGIHGADRLFREPFPLALQ